MKISIVVAMSVNGTIGREGKLPWHMSEDLRHFKDITRGHHVLMGRKTFESIGGPLPERTNLVLSRDPSFDAKGVIIFQDFGDAVRFARDKKEKELMVIGGESVYKFALPLAEKIYMTRILRNVEGDTRFPQLESEKWIETARELHTDGEIYEFRTLERKG